MEINKAVSHKHTMNSITFCTLVANLYLNSVKEYYG